MTRDRVEQFAADIAASPDALARLLDGPPPAPIPATRRICFTGLGSSRYAADVVAGALRAQGRSAWSELASGVARTQPAADLTLVAISASGGTPEVVEAAHRHRGTSHVIAVTNRPDSALAAAADEVVPLLAGDEVSGIACRTFRATLVALAMLGGEGGASRPGFGDLPAHLARRLGASGAWAATAADVMDGAPAIDVLADASAVGVAEQAALMLREAPRLPAHAFETADWLHVGIYLAWPGHVVLHLPGSAADGEVRAIEARRGIRLLSAPPLPDALDDPVARATVASIDGELLAVDAWARPTALDRRADDKDA